MSSGRRSRRRSPRAVRAADTPERRGPRMQRLGIDPAVAEAVLAQRAAALDEPVAVEAPTEVPVEAPTAPPIVLVGDVRAEPSSSDCWATTTLSRWPSSRPATRSPPVERVDVRSNGRHLGFGTGSLVSPRLLLTNNHVLETEVDAADSRSSSITRSTRKAYRLPRCPSPSTRRRSSSPTRSSTTRWSPSLSAGARDSRSSVGTPWSAPRARSARREGEHHPAPLVGRQAAGPAREPDRRSARVLHPLPDRHRPGSSGSPVFSDEWELVALHHSGVPKTDAGRDSRAERGRLDGGDGGEPDQPGWRTRAPGSAVSSSTSRPGLERQGAAVTRPAVRALYAGDRQRPACPAGGETGSVSALPQPDASGDAVWTVPVQITMWVGVPSSAVPAAGTDAQAAAFVAAPAPPPDEDPELIATLRELEIEATATHEAAGEEARERYYGASKPTTSSRVSSTRLSRLVTETPPPARPRPRASSTRGLTCTPMANYGASTRASPSIRRSSSARTSRWSGGEPSPARARPERGACVAPTACSRRRQHWRRHFPTTASTSCPSPGLTSEEPMRGDLHHLFACESNCNSFRGNIPYYEFADFEEAIRDDCGKREENRFEPNAGKGTGLVRSSTSCSATQRSSRTRPMSSRQSEWRSCSPGTRAMPSMTTSAIAIRPSSSCRATATH